MQTIYDPKKPSNDNRKLALVTDNAAQRRIAQRLAATAEELIAQGEDPAAIIEELYRRIVDLAARTDWNVPSEYGDIRLDRYLQLSRIAGDLGLRSVGIFTLGEVDAYL